MIYNVTDIVLSIYTSTISNNSKSLIDRYTFLSQWHQTLDDKVILVVNTGDFYEQNIKNQMQHTRIISKVIDC